MKTTNSKCSRFVELKQSFTANNVFAESSGDHKYIVYSYGYHFPMYLYLNGEWFENSSKYSKTTSKQQNQARPQGVEFTYKTTQELKDLI